MADNEEIDEKEYYAEAIKALVPINELSPSLQNEIINIADIRDYKKKEFIFNQGDRDEFAFYLLDGEVELVADNQVHSTLTSDTDSARYAMARLQPRQFSARAATKKVVILQLDRGALDRLMVAEPQSQESSGGNLEVSDIEAEESGDWMSRMLQSELFCRLPTANIHQLFALLEPLEFKAGDQVITQGDPGEYYYIIQEGRCEVSRAPSAGAKPVKLAELHAGDSFGEEALLTEAKRNASIKMLTDGVLMQLSKDNFINLIKKPSLDVVTFKEGKEKVAAGAVWLDVRFANEHEQSRIEGSINIPLNILRTKLDTLDNDKEYILYCDTAGRSSAAAFLLTDRGFKVSYLHNGLSSVPDEELEAAAAEAGATTQEKTTEKAPEPEKAEEPAKPAEKESVAEPEPEIPDMDEEDETLDTEVRSSVVDTSLARTNMELEEANKKLREADEEKARELSEAKKKLEAEKKKLESEKKAIEKETKKAREKEEARLKKMQEEAKKRLADEKKRLEEVYNRNTQEMEKLQRQKEQAEEQLKKEREKFERETEAARKKMEEEAAKRKEQQEAMERAIQLKAKTKLEAEKRKMAEEFSRTNEELDKARKAKAMAEAARRAAQDEAKNIIEEYKKQFEAEQASEKARLKEERRKLEEEQKKIQATYKEIQRAKQEAEEARKKAEKEVAELKAKQSANMSDKESKAVADEIKAVEERLQEAEKNVQEAETAGESIQAAREINEQELARQQQISEEMRSQVEADLAAFMEEQKEEEAGREKVVANADHIKRIKERAAAAKKEAEKATDDLFADIASQLGKDDE